jgi:hypothetical protein
MKNMVTLDEIHEVELRSQQVFKEYYRLLEKDVPVFFYEKESKERKICPACSSHNYQDQFQKLGFLYRTCGNCGTMFVANRPSDDSILKYHEESESHAFYVCEYLQALENQKGNHLLISRINWILDSIVEYDCPREVFLDLRSKYPFFLETIEAEKFFTQLFYSRPLFDVGRLAGLNLLETGAFRERKDQSISIISAFEFLDSMFNPEEFIRQAYRILEMKGLLFLTTRCISGFDMQILWEHSKSILPPHHVSLFSIEGLILFFESNGFVIRELSTPGQLDLDIVSNALQDTPDIEIPEFVKYLIQNRDSETHKSFKEFLQKHRLSSHTRIVIQKSS